MLRLTTFGGCVITRDGAAIEGLSAQRRAMALLAMVAAAGPSGVSRDVVAARLWPESDDSKARLSLRQLLHVVHTQLAAPELLGSGPDLRLDGNRCSSDVSDFRLTLASGNAAAAAQLYSGPFLAGFFLTNAPAATEWIETERAELAHAAQRALEQLATTAFNSGAYHDAVAHWRRLVTMDPLSGRLAAGYMQALASAGERAAALQHARVYDTLVRQELGSPPDDVVASLSRALRAEPAAPMTSHVDVTGDSSVSRADAPILLRSEGRKTIPIRVSALLVAIAVLGALVVAAGRVARRRSASTPLAIAADTTGSALSATTASVAVLPFVNLSANAADTHASDGLSDELIGTLSRVPGLQVIARTSVFALRDRSLGVRAIADTLRVASVVEGTWRRDGSQLRVTAQLVRGADQAVLWSARYDRDVRDAIAVQDDIARAIAGALLPRLNSRSAASVPPAALGTVDAEARELYLRGRTAFFSRPTRDGIEQSREYFERAIARDSLFARAFAGLSDVWTRLAVFGYVAPLPAYTNAKQAAERALALDSTLSDAHASRGHALYVADFAWEEAERSFRRAVALDPNAAFVRGPFAIGLASQGRFEEALQQLAIARTIDPLSPTINNVLGRVQVQAGRYDDALRTLGEVTTLDPRQDLGWQQLGHAHLLRGEHTLAIAALRRAAALSGARDSAHLAYALAVSGDTLQARRVLRQLERTAGEPDALVVHMAIAYAGLGDRDRAFALLERGYALRASFMIGLAVEPALRSLHGDPRMNALLQQMRLVASERPVTPPRPSSPTLHRPS